VDRCNFQDNLDEIVVSVKSDHSKGTRKLISLEELSRDMWEEKVEPLLRQEHTRFLGYKLEVIVEYTGRINDDKANRKRSFASSSIESLAKSLTLRCTRTVQ